MTREPVLLDRAVGAADAGEPGIDGVDVAFEGRADHRVRVGQGEVQVSGEQVPRAARHDRERNARRGQRFGHRPHGPVAAGGEDGIHLLVEGGASRVVAEVVDGRLVEERLGPVRGGGQLGNTRTQLLGVDLGRVVDERGALFRGGFRVDGGVTAVRRDALGFAGVLVRGVRRDVLGLMDDVVGLRRVFGVRYVLARVVGDVIAEARSVEVLA